MANEANGLPHEGGWQDEADSPELDDPLGRQENGTGDPSIRASPDDEMPSSGAKRMRALFTFEKQMEGDLSFKKDDILELIDDSDENWWKMYHPATKEIGYVPRNHVQLYDVGPTWMACWFEVDRREAERNLLMPGLPEGTYLLRPCRHSKADQAEFCLSVRGVVKSPQPTVPKIRVLHYRVKLIGEAVFYITPNTKFSSIQNLISHYEKSSSSGLLSPLATPCPRKYAPPVHFRDFELNRCQLTLVENICHGTFAHVWKARLGNLVDVLVKQLITNGQSPSMNKQEFIREAETMHRLHHPQIVQLLGVCTQEEPLYIVAELMPNGDLKSYLRKDRENDCLISFNNMLDMLFQVADGMAYLEEKKFVHRDLRAANILVGEDAKVVKISGFGLSMRMEEEAGGSENSIIFPIRWTAPESFTLGKFSSKSDVWSFGVLIYEIVTRGGTPYPGYSNRNIVKMVSKGYRMPNLHNTEQGVHCEEFLYYQIMLACWNEEPSERPNFSTLRGTFESYHAEKEQFYL